MWGWDPNPGPTDHDLGIGLQGPGSFNNDVIGATARLNPRIPNKPVREALLVGGLQPPRRGVARFRDMAEGHHKISRTIAESAAPVVLLLV
ncbi:MAG: hypothetical protein NVS9B1_11460 [Candidatus Dormibacteraceae bacterium]